MEKSDEEFNKLLLEGAVEVAGIDSESGEILYSFTEKLSNVNPLLHTEIMNYFSFHMMKLWELGFVDMDVTEKNPLVRLTEKSFNNDDINNLDSDHIHTLNEIKRILA